MTHLYERVVQVMTNHTWFPARAVRISASAETRPAVHQSTKIIRPFRRCLAAVVKVYASMGLYSHAVGFIFYSWEECNCHNWRMSSSEVHFLQYFEIPLYFPNEKIWGLRFGVNMSDYVLFRKIQPTFTMYRRHWTQFRRLHGLSLSRIDGIHYM
jgi:hypothetical protein